MKVFLFLIMLVTYSNSFGGILDSFKETCHKIENNKVKGEFLSGTENGKAFARCSLYSSSFRSGSPNVSTSNYRAYSFRQIESLKEACPGNDISLAAPVSWWSTSDYSSSLMTSLFVTCHL